WLCSVWIRRPPGSTRFPYTTLFRSQVFGQRHVLEIRVVGLLEALGEPGEVVVQAAQGEGGVLDLLARDVLELHAGHGIHEHHRRSEEHTSELQSRENLVCRLLLEKK